MRQYDSEFSVLAHDHSQLEVSRPCFKIKLPEPVSFTSTVRPVCLPTKSEARLRLSSREALVLGWGVTSDQTQELSRTLQEAEVKTITNTECELQFPMVVRASSLCISGEGGRATCSGDSGQALHDMMQRLGFDFSNRF